MPDDIGEALIRRAQDWGATDLRIERGGKHPRLIGEYDGVAFIFAFPGSTGDRRAVLNCVSDLRRLLRVQRDEKITRPPSKSRPRRTKSKIAPLPLPAEPDDREDRYFAPLAQIRERMLAGLAHKPAMNADPLVSLRSPILGRRPRFQQT